MQLHKVVYDLRKDVLEREREEYGSRFTETEIGVPQKDILLVNMPPPLFFHFNLLKLMRKITAGLVSSHAH